MLKYRQHYHLDLSRRIQEFRDLSSELVSTMNRIHIIQVYLKFLVLREKQFVNSWKSQ